MLLLVLLCWSYLLKNTKVETGLKSLEQLMLEAGELGLGHAWWNLSQSCFLFVADLLPVVDEVVVLESRG